MPELNLLLVHHCIDPFCPALDEFCLSVNNHISHRVLLMITESGGLAPQSGIHPLWSIQGSLSPAAWGSNFRLDSGHGLVCFHNN